VTKSARACGASLCLALWALQAPCWAAYPDGNGREWRQVLATKGISWADLAAACPRGGAAPCSGMVGGVDLDGWTWASHEQVKALFNTLLSDLPGAAPRHGLSDAVGSVAGARYYWLVASLLSSAFEPTYLWPGNYGMGIGIAGMTSSVDDKGQAVMGSFGYGHDMVSIEGHFAIQPMPAALPYAGAWMWRPSTAAREAVVLRAIPEPGTTLMWALGLAGMGLAARSGSQRASQPSTASHSGAVSTKASVEKTMAAVASAGTVL
jgi:hypothetical protein